MQYSLTFSEGEIAEISRHVGSRWHYWGSSHSTNLGGYIAEEFFFRTDVALLVVRADLVPLSFGDDEEEIVSLSIGADEQGFADAIKQGAVFVHHEGELVHSIALIRDIVTRESRNDEVRSLTADRGILFQFETGSLAFSTGGDFSADFFTTSASKDKGLEPPDFSYFWRSTRDERFESRRTFVSISGSTD